MFARIRSGISYANVMATLAMFIALASGSYAAATISSDNRPATTAKKKKHKVKAKPGPRGPRGLQGLAGAPGINGTDASINGVAAGGDLSGNYPNPTLAASEGWHEVGTAGEPAFQNGWSNSGSGFETVAFYKDRQGVVHLKGTASGSNSMAIFQLPAGYRPASGKELQAPAVCGCTYTDDNPDVVSVPTGKLVIYGTSGAPALSGALAISGLASFVSFDGVTFRAAS